MSGENRVRIGTWLKNSRLAQISAALAVLLFVLFSVAVIRAETIEVEIDNRIVHLTTTWESVGEALSHSGLGIYPEDTVVPDRSALVEKGLTIKVTRSVPLSLNVDGETIKARSPGQTVGEALTELSDRYGLALKESDEVSVDRANPLKAGMELKIYRSMPITVVADGQTVETELAPRTVAQVLNKLNITLGSLDKVSLEMDHIIQPKDTIKVVRVEERVEKIKTEVPFQTVANPGDFPLGLPDRIVSRGASGFQEQVVKLTLEDGAEVDREILEQKIVQTPVNQVVSRGTQTSVSRGGQTISFLKAYSMKATAYSAPGGRTATGAATGAGVVAVDPKVIPLGTRLYIDGYGEAIALDTGGAIKGNKIDLHMDTEEQCWSWGVRNVTVYVLN